MASPGIARAPDSYSQWAKMTIERYANAGIPGLSRSVATGDVRTALAEASRATGVDFAYLAAKASIESGLDPQAKAPTSSAAGLFQFIESTWSEMVERHGAKIGLEKEAAALASGDVSRAERRRIMDLRFDPGVAARMGAEFAAENRDHLVSRLGREPEDVDLYLAHFLGPGGASKFLKAMEANPQGKAAELFPSAAKANRSVFYDGGRARSFNEIRERFDRKLEARADDVTAPTGFADAAGGRPKLSMPPISPGARPGAISLAAATPSLAASPKAGGDPWLTTLMTAQLSMNDSLYRVRREDGELDRSFRNLLS